MLTFIFIISYIFTFKSSKNLEFQNINFKYLKNIMQCHSIKV